MAIAPGDIVVLKSGGQPLTVVAVEGTSVECIWLADDGKLYREAIPDLALTAAEELDSENEDVEEAESSEGENAA
jgi:uncharacterized protein YodC (DUF2158 family)